MIRIQKKEDCCGCHACAQICPGKCIEMRPDEEGFLYPRIDAAACVQCGLCEQVCPVLHPQPEPQSKQPAAYAAINRDETVRHESSSGGVFDVIPDFTAEKSRIDADITLSLTLRQLIMTAIHTLIAYLRDPADDNA